MEIIVRSEKSLKIVERAPKLLNRLYFSPRTELKAFLWLLWSINKVSRFLASETLHIIKFYSRNKV